MKEISIRPKIILEKSLGFKADKSSGSDYLYPKILKKPKLEIFGALGVIFQSFRNSKMVPQLGGQQM